MDFLKKVLREKKKARWLESLLGLAVLAYLAIFIYKRWQEVDVVSLSLSTPVVLASALILVLFYLVFSNSWRKTLLFVEAKISDFSGIDLHRVFIYALLTRYLPAGNVVTIGSRVGFYKSLGGSGSKGFEAVYHEQIYLTLGAFSLAATSLLFAPAGSLPEIIAKYRLVLIFGFILSVIGLGVTTDFALNIFSRIMPIKSFEQLGISLDLKEKVELLGRFIVVNGLQSTAAYLGVWSVYPDIPKDPASVLLIGSAYPISRFVGQLAAVVPGGIGVREGAFAFLLSSYIPIQALVLGGAVVRLLSVLVELMNAGGIILWNWLHKNNP